MSQNRKRPVTYGKSPFNRLDPQISATRPSKLRTSHIDKPKQQAHQPSSPGHSPGRSVPPPRSPQSSSVLASNQGNTERSSVRRKRRKIGHEEADSGNARKQTKSDALAGENLTDLGVISTGDSDDDEWRSNLQAASNAAPEAKPANRSPALLRPPASGHKLISPSRTRRRSVENDSRDASQRDGTRANRKRLIDLLGAADERTRVLIPLSDDGPETAHSSPSSVAEVAGSGLASRKFTHITPENAKHDSESIRNPAAATPSSMLRSSGVTYSRQRSFLNDTLDLTDEPHLMRTYHELESPRKSRDVHTTRLPSEEGENHDSKPVRSIHELRQAGDNARFRGAVDSLFEEIEGIDGSASGRCCGLAELCQKLLDSRFAHRFSEQGFDERLVNCASIDQDSIYSSLELSAYKLILTSGHASRVFTETLWTKVLALVPPLLDIEDDLVVLARKPPSSLSKTAQASIKGTRSHLISEISPQALSLSPQLVALECTRSALIVLRQNGHNIRPLSTSFLSKVVDLMAINATSALRASRSADQYQLLDLAFSILENYSVVSGSFDTGHQRCLERLSHLHALLNQEHDDRIRPLAMSYVRVILNLTNTEPALCNAFAVPDLVAALAEIVTAGFCDISRGHSKKEQDSLNEVILGLGTLINLTEETRQSRNVLTDSDDRSVPFLDRLLEQFSNNVRSIDQAHSFPEVQKNVVTGYLSILLLTICFENKARLLVKNHLAGDGLSLVLSTAEKFLQYHREVEKDTRLFETWEQGESKLTGRIEHIISQIRRLEETC